MTFRIGFRVVSDVSRVLGQHCFDNQFAFPVETLTKNLDILKYRNKRCKPVEICRYKLENTTLNSVLDCDSNKTITKKICLKGPKFCS